MKSVLCVIAFALLPASVLAQTIVSAADTAEPPSVRVGSRVGMPPSSYDDGGRRDPFSSLILPKPITAAALAAAPRRRVGGLGDLSVADAEVKGIMGTGTTMIAILEGPNHQSFFVHAKDHLLDGSVLSIDERGVEFAGPGPSGPTNRVRKALRATQEER